MPRDTGRPWPIPPGAVLDVNDCTRRLPRYGIHSCPRRRDGCSVYQRSPHFHQVCRHVSDLCVLAVQSGPSRLPKSSRPSAARHHETSPSLLLYRPLCELRAPHVALSPLVTTLLTRPGAHVFPGFTLPFSVQDRCLALNDAVLLHVLHLAWSHSLSHLARGHWRSDAWNHVTFLHLRRG